MILEAAGDMDIDIEQSYMVGDSDSDIAAAQNAGVRAVRIGAENDPKAHLTFQSLMDFAYYLEQSARNTDIGLPGENNE